MKSNKCKLGDIITQRREKNNEENLPICGVTREGFIPPKQKDADTSLYNVFYKKDFVFNPARMESVIETFNKQHIPHLQMMMNNWAEIRSLSKMAETVLQTLSSR